MWYHQQSYFFSIYDLHCFCDQLPSIIGTTLHYNVNFPSIFHLIFSLKLELACHPNTFIPLISYSTIHKLCSFSSCHEWHSGHLVATPVAPHSDSTRLWWLHVSFSALRLFNAPLGLHNTEHLGIDMWSTGHFIFNLSLTPGLYVCTVCVAMVDLGVWRFVTTLPFDHF